MATDFSSLKKNRKNKFGQLQKKAVEDDNQYTDERIWSCARDKQGNGTAIIRFLPAPENEDFEWVKTYEHGFEGKGGWYIENSLTTIDKTDPCGEYNNELWHSGIEANKEFVKNHSKRRLQYYVNVYVITDKSNPQNE